MRSSTVTINRPERFRNTIDPEFTSLRIFFGRCKTTGLIQILLGCTMLGTAVFIILGFKATFLEGQSVGSRITPNLIIGFTCLFAGARAFMIKGEVGFTLDYAGLKCVVGLCCVLTIVAFAMSVILIGLSSYELYTLVHGKSRYSHVNERIGLNILNIVFSCVSSILCLACIVVYIQMASRLPRRKEKSSLKYKRKPEIALVHHNDYGQYNSEANSQHPVTTFTYTSGQTDLTNPEPTRVNNGTIHHYM